MVKYKRRFFVYNRVKFLREETNMKKWKTFGTAALAAMMAVGGVGMLAGCNNTSDADTFTIWMASSVNSSIYNDYGENPFIQYLEKKFDINLEFTTPMLGKELEDFNKLIGSGSYPDVMDLTFYTDSIGLLYDDGYGAAMDLTQYIEDYMPNYSQFMADNAQLTQYAKIDGMYLTLNNYNEAIPNQWGGWMYRRDWIVDYGESQTKGTYSSVEEVEKALSSESAERTGAFIEPVADDSYEGGYAYADGIVFPDGFLTADGYDNPLTLRDWEWMFEIFMQNEYCEYCISLPNIGYHGTGELISAFGAGPLWNAYDDGTGTFSEIKFGPTEDGFRRYLEKMNEWYEKGWLDPNFTSTSGDMFYAIDGESITSGVVGMWYGTTGQLGDHLAQSSTQTIAALEGIDAWGARQPREGYGAGDEASGMYTDDPSVFYLDSQETSRRWIVTDAAEGKNLEKLFTMLDWLYSEEGSIIKTYGLSLKELEEYDIDTSLLEEYGLLEEGCWWWADEDGNRVEEGTPGAKVFVNSKIKNATGDIAVATNSVYFFGLGYDVRGLEYDQEPFVRSHAYDEWAVYNNYGALTGSFTSQFTIDEGSAYNATQETIREYLGKEVPNLIKSGVTDASWNAFLGALRTRKCDSNTELLQSLYDRLH